MTDNDPRPAAATGHVFLRASDVASGAARLESVGLRVVTKRDTIAILELRGGTHVVVRPLEGDGPFEAGFDLMFDDIDDAHAGFKSAGFTVSEIEAGRIHRAFNATAPERYTIRVLDSHAGDRPV